jgi:DNA-binding HxlR family transcriptional regulator
MRARHPVGVRCGRNAVPGVSGRCLRALERDGLVTRTITLTVPVTVEYALTSLGSSLHRTTRQLRAWAQGHMDAVRANRDRYDANA